MRRGDLGLDTMEESCDLVGCIDDLTRLALWIWGFGALNIFQAGDSWSGKPGLLCIV